MPTRSRRTTALLGLLCLLAGCSGSAAGREARPTASVTASPTERPASAARRYEQLVLRAGPLALWPLAGAPATTAAALEDPRFDGRLVGAGAVAPTTGPVLLGQSRPATRFTGASRYRTSLELGGATSPAWTVEFWYRAEGCGVGFERVAGNSALTATGREGIDVFHYPPNARRPCEVAAELWSHGRYTGGCTSTEVPDGQWHHYAVTRADAVTTCWLDGRRVNARRSADPSIAPGAQWGIGGTASGYGATLRGDLADLALYARPLPAAVVRAHAAAAR